MAPKLRITSAAWEYWTDRRSRSGFFAATGDLIRVIWGFLRDSTPSRLRSRFGDADYDWDYRVNTTSGAVEWRDRLLGVFHSPYQPTERELFHEIIHALEQQENFNFPDFTFVDLGSGKGRTLLMASDYPFRRIVGVELLPALHAIAIENLAQYRNESQKCFACESICADATRFPLPEGPLVIYLFNPFPEAGLLRAMANLEKSIQMNPRPAYVLYHNPEFEQVLTGRTMRLRKMAGTLQYSIFAVDIGTS